MFHRPTHLRATSLVLLLLLSCSLFPRAVHATEVPPPQVTKSLFNQPENQLWNDLAFIQGLKHTGKASDLAPLPATDKVAKITLTEGQSISDEGLISSAQIRGRTFYPWSITQSIHFAMVDGGKKDTTVDPSSPYRKYVDIDYQAANTAPGKTGLRLFSDAGQRLF